VPANCRRQYQLRMRRVILDIIYRRAASRYKNVRWLPIFSRCRTQVDRTSAAHQGVHMRRSVLSCWHAAYAPCLFFGRSDAVPKTCSLICEAKSSRRDKRSVHDRNAASTNTRKYPLDGSCCAGQENAWAPHIDSLSDTQSQTRFDRY
jgi:hypothetical protein